MRPCHPMNEMITAHRLRWFQWILGHRSGYGQCQYFRSEPRVFNFLVSVLSQEWMYATMLISLVSTMYQCCRAHRSGTACAHRVATHDSCGGACDCSNSNQSLSMEWQHVISLLGMAAYVMT